jgi:hypothetical protein
MFSIKTLNRRARARQQLTAAVWQMEEMDLAELERAAAGEAKR